MRAGIVGGGIAGISLARFLAEAGVAVTVFERGPQLCSGATWHAAGLVTRFAGSPKLKKVHVRAMDLIHEVEAKVARDIGFHHPGSIRLVEKGNRDRYLEAQQQVAMASLYDHPEENLQTRLISPDEIQELHPLINTDSIECGVWTQEDGYIDPTSLTNAIAELAKMAGAKIKLGVECTQVERDEQGFRINTRSLKDGEVDEYNVDVLVNAAGLWSREFSQKIMGMTFQDHPCKVIQHQYVITETIPAIKARMAEGKGVLPVLRDLRGSAYIRQERTGMLIGPYETQCAMAPWDSPPQDFLFELFPPALERLEDNLEQAFSVVPALSEAGIMNVTNGPTIWTGDGSPRVGRTTIPGYYDFNTLSYGITHGLPLAEYLSHVIMQNEQPPGWDLTEFEPARYQGWTTPEFVEEKVKETYKLNSAVNYGSFENRKAGRHLLPKSKIFEVLEAEGARFGIGMGGVEHPLYFAAADVEINPAKFTHHDWTHIVKDEADVVLNNVSLGYGLFSVFKVDGSGATDLLESLTTSALPSESHKSKLMYMLNKSGGVIAEVTVCRLGEEEYYVVGGRDNIPIDLAILRNGVQNNALVKDISGDVEILHVAGPNSAALLHAINNEVGSIPFLGMKEIELGGVQCKVFRITFTGCLGYEIHVPAKHCDTVYAAIAERDSDFGTGRFGSYAMNSLRIEKAFVLKADLDFAHYKEASLGFFVSKTKEFLGKDLKYKPTRRRVSFVVATGDGYAWSVPGDSPIHRRDTNERVGFTTSSAVGAITGETIALGYLHGHNLAEVKEQCSRDLYVSCYGKEWDVRAQIGPIQPMTGREEVQLT
eukprot:m.66162 g.66162  ORF g.66162 m.66162 type:complete len:824 (+) comp23656_c0_seq1:236-2707(+)